MSHWLRALGSTTSTTAWSLVSATGGSEDTARAVGILGTRVKHC